MTPFHQLLNCVVHIQDAAHQTVHLLVQTFKSVLHHLHVVEGIGHAHGQQPLLFLADPQLARVHLAEHPVHGERVAKPLAPQGGHLGHLCEQLLGFHHAHLQRHHQRPGAAGPAQGG